MGQALVVMVGAAISGLAGCNQGLSSDYQAPDMGGPPPPPDMAFTGPYGDLPAAPIAAGNVPSGTVAGLAAAFAAAPRSPSGGPCITEPAFGALYPSNFTPPLIEWQPGAQQNTFELRFHVDNQAHDLLVYTDGSSYTLPAALWHALTLDSADHDIQITVRGAQVQSGKLSGPVATGSSGAVHIAPVPAQGAIVYWTTSNNTALKGFHIGDPQVVTVLSPASISAAGKDTSCVGCHASSPDGLLAFFGRADPSFSVDARRVDGSSGAPTAGQVTANALANLARTDQDLPTLSRAHYGPGDAVVVTVMKNDATGGKWELAWTDLHAQSGGTGTLPRMDDSRGAATPWWSQDGTTIAYTSSDAVVNGRLDQGVGEIWTVPYNNHQGGPAKPLPGINGDPHYNQYYPVYSPGDTLLAFNRNAAGSNMYNSPSAEVWVVAGRGGTPTRLPANDPPACGGQHSPGLTNSWPRWSPNTPAARGKHYYWLVFSSRRRPGGNPQLYLTAVVTRDDETGAGAVQVYPAVYITTQPPGENNHTPAWDQFMIQPIG